MSRMYTLQAPDFCTPVLCTKGAMHWAVWMEAHQRSRQVAVSVAGPVRVSTVFLGLDHNHGGKGPPVLWETMVFGGKHDQHQRRYTSYADAKAGHAEILLMVTNEEDSDEAQG